MERKTSQTDEVICLGCGDTYIRGNSIDISPWGHCIMCKSKTLRELLSQMKADGENSGFHENGKPFTNL